MSVNLYDVLGVASNATTEQIRAAYRELSKMHHPDKNGGERSAMWDVLNTAHQVLADPQARFTYDQTGLNPSDPDNKLSINALALVNKVVVQMVTGNPNADVLRATKMELDRLIEIDQGQITSLDMAIQRANASKTHLAQRWKGAESIRDAAIRSLESAIEQAEQQKMPIQEHRKIVEAALVYLDSASYDMPAPARWTTPTVANSWIINLG